MSSYVLLGSVASGMQALVAHAAIQEQAVHVVYQKHQARCCKQRVSLLHIRGCLTIVSCSSGFTAVVPISNLGLCVHSDCVRCGRSKTSECIGTLRCCGDSLLGTILCLVPHSIVV